MEGKKSSQHGVKEIQHHSARTRGQGYVGISLWAHVTTHSLTHSISPQTRARPLLPPSLCNLLFVALPRVFASSASVALVATLKTVKHFFNYSLANENKNKHKYTATLKLEGLARRG